MEPKFIGKARLTKQGQLTLPQEAREDLSIDANSEVYWYEFNDTLVLVKDLKSPSELMNFVMKKKRKK
ncbi:AbrB/MazE/SpoVT family DNA-binding domain-containing protein [Candidatus Woesearchaeota archaeon]|nr:AbrB/MazE/SpoVT family DNA-binding domain-containing protein [Candidatus Woesearchaeota archaeon]